MVLINGMVQTTDDKSIMPYIANSGPPVLNLVSNYNLGDRESENIEFEIHSVFWKQN